jgi:large subunit GTPase 1
MEILNSKCKALKKTKDDRLMVGMVGYPNVGKSSVINVLCGKKRVGVAAMPGKTKHFQTLNLEDDNICLCDCPGLVFPSFANSKGEMVCCGVLPIDKIKDFIAPVSLIVNRVNKEMIERIYKLKLPDVKSKYFNASTFLQIYAAKKGMVTGRALPNEAQAARLVLKDYVNGKLLFCNMRPDYDPAVHGVLEQCGEYRLPNAASTI